MPVFVAVDWAVALASHLCCSMSGSRKEEAMIAKARFLVPGCQCCGDSWGAGLRLASLRLGCVAPKHACEGAFGTSQLQALHQASMGLFGLGFSSPECQ